MKILVFGNINSGKSYIVEKLKKELKGYNIVKIDEYRKLYSNGTIHGEEKAVYNFLEDILNLKNVIVEFTGLGNIATKLYEKIPSKSFIILKLKVPLNVALERIDNAKFKDIPYPYKKEESIIDTIKRLGGEIEEKEIENIWKQKALDIIEIDSSIDIVKLNIVRYENIIDTINVLKSKDYIKEVVLYGSLGRREFRISSDADIMVTTNKEKKDIQNILSKIKGVTFYDILPDKITLYFNKFLIEIAVVKEVYENKLYYTNSHIEDIPFTIVKGNEDTLKNLQLMCSNFNEDRNTLIKETIKRLVYFVLSLDNIKEDNQYKFFFHSNIITHEIIRLKKQINGELKYNYLPKDSDGIFKELDSLKLIYNYNDDRKLYIKNIRKYVFNLLNEVEGIDKKYIEQFKKE